MNSWITKGFEGFRKGTFGNAGHNIYVSRAGVLQRIHQFDLTGNGYVDLVFCNSQSHWEQPPCLIYQDPVGEGDRLELPCHGAWGATVCDLNGDGFDDFILAHVKDGVSSYQNATIYYGSPEGLTEKYVMQLPAPLSKSVCAGDFNGDGKPDLAFLIQAIPAEGTIRIFYQGQFGIEMKSFVDLDIVGHQIEAGDLDGDGYEDLLVRRAEGQIAIYWGGPDGISPQCSTNVPIPAGTFDDSKKKKAAGPTNLLEYVVDAPPLVKMLKIDDTPHLLVLSPHQANLLPVSADRQFGTPLVFNVKHALSAAIGDINSDGYADIAFACRDESDGAGTECSWVYWGSENGFDETRRSQIKTHRACDVNLGDLSGNGCDDILFCQNRIPDSFTTESLIYRGSPDGIDPEPVRLESHDARRGFIARTSSAKRPQVLLPSNFSRGASDDIYNYIYIGDKDGFDPKRMKRVSGWGSAFAFYTDLNDDGLADLVIGNASEYHNEDDRGSFVFYNTADGFAYRPDQVLPTNRNMGGALADLDRDGYLDVVMGGYNNPDVLIFHGGPNGFDTKNPERIHFELDGETFDNPDGLCLGDINNDGWLDLVVALYTKNCSFILWGGPSGFSMDRCQKLAIYNGSTSALADLTGNGYLDVIIASDAMTPNQPLDSYIYIYWNGPDGIKEDRRTMLPGKCSTAMAVADFNNDGRLDIFAGSYADPRDRDVGSYIYWNRAGRGFSARDRAHLPTACVGGCMAADFNEDGWVDLCITNHKARGDHQCDSEIWWNGPKGFNQERTTKLPTIGARGPVNFGPGSVADRGPTEYYTSAAEKLPDGVRVSTIEWTADVPPKTWVKAQLRFAGSEADLADEEWAGPEGAGSWYENGSQVNHAPTSSRGWVQYRLALGATNSCSSPRITEVRVGFG